MSDERIAALEAELAELKRFIGFDRFNSPRLGLAEWSEAKNSAALLPNGDRNVADRMRELGVSQDFIVESVAPELRARIAQVESKAAQIQEQINNAPQVPAPVQNVEIPGDLRSALEAIGVVFNSQGTLRGFKVAEYGNPEGAFYGFMGADDAAMRWFSGIRAKIGQAWPNVDTNENLPVLMGPVMERDGGLSYDISPPLAGGINDTRPGKTWIEYFGGFIRGVGPRARNNVGPYMDFGTFEAGRGIRLFVRRPGSPTPDTEVILQLDAQGLAVRVAGGLRRVHMNGDGTLRAGDPIIEDQ